MLDSGLSVQQLVKTAWSAAASFRSTDMRGGANGARIRLEPQKNWEVNEPSELAKVLPVLEKIQQDFNGAGGKKVSLADLIVLGVPRRSRRRPRTPASRSTCTSRRAVPTRRRRTPTSSRSRSSNPEATASATTSDRARRLRLRSCWWRRPTCSNLTAPELTVLVGGLRALNVNHGGSKHGVFTDKPGVLTNDFFVNLLDMGTEWKSSGTAENVYEGVDRASGQPKWTATANDLVFGSTLAAAGAGRALRPGGQQAEVRRGLRRGLGQGHEQRPVRPGLTDNKYVQHPAGSSARGVLWL